MTADNTISSSNHSIWPGKLTFALLCLTVALPMLAAYWVYHTASAIPDSTVNKGKLIVPATTLTTLPIKQASGQASPWLDGRKWRMVTIVDDHCNSNCMQNLYNSHQVHVRLAKDAERIERFLLLLTDTPNAIKLPEIAKNDPGLQIITSQPQSWQSAFADTSLQDVSDALILVDQQGFAMMSYSDANTGSDVLDDLKRLLKYSYE